MTNTYLIHAWCVRPFIAYLDPVEAATPEEAIAIARRQPEKLLDTAEECNGQYPWDEFAAHDEDGNELLHILDAPARLREAAPELLAALRRIDADARETWQQDEKYRPGIALILDLTESAIAQVTLA